MIRNVIEGPKFRQRRSIGSVIFSAMAIAGYTLTWIVALLLISEYGLRLASRWYHRGDATVIANRPAYEHAPWASQFALDFVVYLKARGSYTGVYTYAPFTVVDSEPFHSQYVNVDVTALGALRRSISHCEDPSITVWAFGGSTTFGIGVPDDMTWPSYLAESLGKLTGQCVAVENFGVETLSMNQELIRLMQALKTGRKPDLVVFYDGANDASFGTNLPGPKAYGYYEDDKPLMDERHSMIAPLQNLKLVQLVRRGLRRANAGQAQTIEIQGEIQRIGASDQESKERAKRTMDNYIANMEVVQALADAYHFRVYFFWQPVSFYGKPHACKEAWTIIANQGSSHGTKAVQETYQEAEERAGGAGITSLVHLFDETNACVFVDPVHLGPAGNRLVAAAIAATIMAGKDEHVQHPAHPPLASSAQPDSAPR